MGLVWIWLLAPWGWTLLSTLILFPFPGLTLGTTKTQQVLAGINYLGAVFPVNQLISRLFSSGLAVFSGRLLRPVPLPDQPAFNPCSLFLDCWSDKPWSNVLMSGFLFCVNTLHHQHKIVWVMQYMFYAIPQTVGDGDNKPRKVAIKQ